MTVLICDPRLDMERPPARWLTATEKLVLLTVFNANTAGRMPTPRIVSGELGLTLGEVNSALHVLGGHDLIRGTRPL